jgi:hypothetical protein
VHRVEGVVDVERDPLRHLREGGAVEPDAFAAHCAELRGIDWVVYAKRPFGGPEQVLAYLGRYTHRVAIANSRIVAMADGTVSFRWKDYRREGRNKVMTLDAGEFMRRFLLHVLPPGFHRIRHFGFMANSHRAARLTRCRRLLAEQPALDKRVVDPPAPPAGDSPPTCHDPDTCPCCCPCCGGVLRIVSALPRAPPHPASRRR